MRVRFPKEKKRDAVVFVRINFSDRNCYSCVDPTVNKPYQTISHRKAPLGNHALSCPLIRRGFQRPTDRSVATAPVAQHAPADASPVHGDTRDPHTHRAKMLAIGASSRVATGNVAAPARAVTRARSSSTGAKAAHASGLTAGAVPVRASALAASRRTRVGARKHGLTVVARAANTALRRTRATRASPPAWEHREVHPTERLQKLQQAAEGFRRPAHRIRDDGVLSPPGAPGDAPICLTIVFLAEFLSSVL